MEIQKVKKDNAIVEYFRSGGGGVLIALIVMIVGMSIFKRDSFLTVLNITNLVKQIATNALLAFALT